MAFEAPRACPCSSTLSAYRLNTLPVSVLLMPSNLGWGALSGPHAFALLFSPLGLFLVPLLALSPGPAQLWVYVYKHTWPGSVEGL